MQQGFHKNIARLLPETNGHKVLLAVSGGIDSMVMLDLFIKEGLDIGIAHCNFQLRGQESDDDELFIREKAEKEDITLYVNRFETDKYAQSNKISIQMAARDLRYEWFFQLLKNHGFTKIALAHNLDDKVETFFINLVRGTGLKGITGMKKMNGEIVRPLLDIPRSEIKKYAEENNIAYREDSSNISTKYLRNKIRHDVIPDFKACSASFLDTMGQNMARFEKSWQVYREMIAHESKKMIDYDSNAVKISIHGLKENRHREILAFEIFSSYHFSQTVIDNILNSLDHQPGLRFFSPTHRCIKDRGYLLVTKREHSTPKKYYIEKDSPEINIPIKLAFETIEYPSDYEISKSRQVAQLDFHKLNFPLILRKWEKGDYFQPLGMTGMKKLSDFFSDKKFSLLDKEKTWILTSGEKIVWIVGHRIDDRFKITETTEKLLVIRLMQSTEEV